MEPNPMAEVLHDHAIKYYGQANHTIFGHGEVHDLLIEYLISKPMYDKILDGILLGLAHLLNRTEGQIYFIKHMKSKIPDEVEDYLRAMVDPMIL